MKVIKGAKVTFREGNSPGEKVHHSSKTISFAASFKKRRNFYLLRPQSDLEAPGASSP